MYDSPYSNITYDQKINAVICTWKQICDAENYHMTMLEGINKVIKTQSKSWIEDFLEDVDKIPEDLEWFVNSFLPLTIENSIEYIYFVMRPECTIKKDIEMRAELYKDFFNVKIFSSLEEACAALC